MEIRSLAFGSVTVDVALRAFPGRPTSLETAALLPDLLAARAGESPDNWSVSHDPYGAPIAFRKGRRQPLSVSLSRTFGQAAACVSPMPVGIDIEYVEPHAADVGLAAEFFSAAEQAYLAQCAPAEWPTGFFRIWTLKEACLKALGCGFRVAMPSFSVAGPDGMLRLLRTGRNITAYRLESLVLPGDHVLSIVAAACPGDADCASGPACPAECGILL